MNAQQSVVEITIIHRSKSDAYHRCIISSCWVLGLKFWQQYLVLNRAVVLHSFLLLLIWSVPCGAGAAHFPPCPFTSSFPLLLFPFFIGFTYFLLLSIPSLSTRIVPLRFQAGGRRRRPNLGLVCFLCNLCYLYSLVYELWCFVLFGLVLCVLSVLWHCWLGHLTRKNPSPIWAIFLHREP